MVQKIYINSMRILDQYEIDMAEYIIIIFIIIKSNR